MFERAAAAAAAAAAERKSTHAGRRMTKSQLRAE
jgi:hypothetical protein